jgi:hypothetical protein
MDINWNQKKKKKKKKKLGGEIRIGCSTVRNFGSHPVHWNGIEQNTVMSNSTKPRVDDEDDVDDLDGQKSTIFFII